MTRIVAINGSRDGVGKTMLATGIAERLAACGQRVCLLELLADTGAGGILAGASVAATLSDRLSGTGHGANLAVGVPGGFDVAVGGASNWLRDLSPEQMGRVGDALHTLGDYDFLLIDTGAGTAQNQLAFSLASPELLVVITPAREHLSDTYRILKLLYAEQYDGRIGIVVNRCVNPTVGRHAYDKLKEVTSFYLDLRLPLAGLVGELPELPSPGRAALSADAADIDNLAAYLLAPHEGPVSFGITAYARRLAGAIAASPVGDQGKPVQPVFSRPRPDVDLQHQLDMLSTQIDELIAEVGRLRGEDTRQAPEMPHTPRGGQECEPPRDCHNAWIADIASSSERVNLDGECYSIYYLGKSNGKQQRFACHGIDDDLEEPAPQTGSS